MKNIVKVTIITLSFIFVPLHTNGMEIESGEPSRPRTFIPKAPLTVQTPQVSLLQIAAFNFYQQFIEPFLQAKRMWEPTNMQIITQIIKNLGEKSVLKKLNLTWDDAREILNKKPEIILEDILNRLQTLKQANLAYIKPYLHVIIKAERNQLLTKDEIETLIPYLHYAPTRLLALRAIIYSLNQLDKAEDYIKTLPLDQKSKDELSTLLTSIPIKNLTPNQKIILEKLLTEIGLTKNQISKIIKYDKAIIVLMATDIELTKPLLQIFNPNINIKGVSGENALIIASARGHRVIVQLLIQYGADPNIIESHRGNTALMVASARGHREIVQLLLQYGATPNIKNQNGDTALMVASEKGHKYIVQLLLQYDATPNIKNLAGVTALIFASINGHTEVVQLLLQNHANPNIQDTLGRTALGMASQLGHKDTVQLLLQNHANPNVKNYQGKTALDWAEQKGHTEIAAMLRRAMERSS